MLELFADTLLLIELHYSIHWDCGGYGQRFPPVAFAANLVTESPEIFLQSLDFNCLGRIQATTKHTAYRFDKPVNYEAERSFVWSGLEETRLSIRGLSPTELESQLKLIKKRGYRDYVRVDMAVEIEAGTELENRGRAARYLSKPPAAALSMETRSETGSHQEGHRGLDRC